MRIMLKETKPSGAFYNIQSCGSSTVPEGFYEVADGVELSCGGFGTLTIVDNVVTAFTPDTEAWAAWQAANPEATAQPTAEDRLSAAEAAITALMGV